MGDGHILTQTAHGCIIVGVNRMDERTGSKEKECLEHRMSEQMEH